MFNSMPGCEGQECEVAALGDVGAIPRLWCVFFFQAEDGIRDAQESRGLGDVYKRQHTSIGCGLQSFFNIRNYCLSISCI